MTKSDGMAPRQRGTGVQLIAISGGGSSEVAGLAAAFERELAIA